MSNIAARPNVVRILAAIDAKGLRAQRDVCAVCGVHHKTLRKILEGRPIGAKDGPQIGVFFKFIHALEIPIEEALLNAATRPQKGKILSTDRWGQKRIPAHHEKGTRGI